MSEQSFNRDRVELLAAEFINALRDGGEPTIDQYAADNPEQAAEIRDLFPTIIAMERLKADQETRSTPTSKIEPTDIERLGDLRIIREIGRGGMGVVYEAEQESLGRRVAVKVLPKQQLNSEKSLARFLRESKTAAKLHHTNIVPVLGVGADEGYHYYVMQYIRGVGLDEVIGHLRGPESTSDAPASTRPPANLSDVAVELLEQAEGDDGTDSRSPGLDETLTSVGALDDTDLSVDGAPDESFSPANPSAAIEQPFAHKYWRSVASIGQDVANALEYAHEHGTLHRDIKPSNLLLDSDGEISVADFGLAKSIGQDDLSRTGDIVGTLRYMAPEQFTGNADARSDVYSLGVTLYELVTLHPAYNESERAKSLIHGNAILPVQPRHVRRDIPSDLETIILKAINIEPERRYQTAEELAGDLQRYCEDRPILARRTSPVERTWRWSRRNPAIASLCAIAASLLVAIAGVSMVASYKTNQAREAAERTAQHAFDALDRIFLRLAPQPTVAPDAFAADSSEEETVATVLPPVLTKQSAALLDEMLIFYDKLAAEGNQDARYRERFAEANRRVGDIRQRLGQNELAEAAYRQSLELYLAFDQSEQTPSMVARIAAIHNELGKSLRRPRPLKPNRDEGLAEFKKAQSMLEPIAGPESAAEIRYELAHSYYLQGMKPPGFRGGSGRGGPGRGGPRFGRGGRRRPDGDRPDRGGPDRVGPDHFDRGHRSPPRGGPDRDGDRPQVDRESLAKAIELLEGLVSEHPANPDYQRLLAMSYLQSAEDDAIEHSSEGKRLRNEAVVLLSDLVDRFPSNPDYRFALTASYVMSRPSGRRVDDEDVRTKLDDLQKSEDLLGQLRRDYPSVPQYLAAQMQLFRHICMVHKSNRDYDQALQTYRRAANIAQDSSPDALTVEAALAVSELYYRFVELLRQEARRHPEQRDALLQEAKTHLETNLQLFEQHADPNADLGRRLTFTGICKELAQISRELGDEDSANWAIEKIRQVTNRSTDFRTPPGQ